MKTPTHCPRIIVLMLVTLAILASSGCSLRRLAITNADRFALRYLIGYVDLTSEQEDFVLEDLRTNFQWVKETQFPIAQRALYEAENRLSGVVTETDVGHLFSIGYKLREDIGARFAPSGAKLVASLSSEQLDELAENLEKSNESLVIRTSLKDAKLLSSQYEKTYDFAEQFVGDLSDDQELKLQEIYPASREGLERALSGRRRSQELMLALFRSGKTQAELEQVFLSWAKEPHLMRGESRDIWEQREQGRRERAAQFIGILTQKQKAHFKKELSGLAKDLRP